MVVKIRATKVAKKVSLNKAQADISCSKTEETKSMSRDQEAHCIVRGKIQWNSEMTLMTCCKMMASISMMMNTSTSSRSRMGSPTWIKEVLIIKIWSQDSRIKKRLSLFKIEEKSLRNCNLVLR